jgi:DNA-binding NarL/FixJ family response regulator
MQSKRPKLIVLCTDLPTVRAITDAAGRHFDLLWSRDLSGLDGCIRQEPSPSAVLVDHAAAHVPSIQALESVRSGCPTAKRILITDYCDLGIIVQGLHTGAIERIVYKPVHAPELLAAVGAEQLPTALVTPSAPAARPAPPRAAG